MGEPAVRDQLEKYIMLKTEVERYIERDARRRSEEQFPASRSGDGSQHRSGTGDQLERRIISRLDDDEVMKPHIEACLGEMEEIRKMIYGLGNALHRDILRCRYMEGYDYKLLTWPEVALMIFRNNDEKYVKAVQRAHKKALKAIEKSRQ